MATANPFSPTFGSSPPELAGRDDVLDAIDDAFETGTTHPDYSALLIGARGTGKTVLLEAAEERARGRGWLTISETAFPTGLQQRIARRAIELLGETDDESAKWKVSGLQVGGVSVERLDTDDARTDLRFVLAALGDLLDEHGIGLLITLDELQAGDVDEIREFGIIFQHVTRREGRPIAFVGAGLPSIEDDLLAGDTSTFLQRCSKHEIGRLNRRASRTAIAKPINDRGARISAEELEVAVAATAGYPFMVQLVGFHTWKASENPEAGITAAEVSVGIDEAERRLGHLVLLPTWKDLSEMDHKFLVAMTIDHDESKLADIAARLQRDIGYAGVYRRRLIKTGVIKATGGGRVAFAHPATRDWVRTIADVD